MLCLKASIPPSLKSSSTLKCFLNVSAPISTRAVKLAFSVFESNTVLQKPFPPLFLLHGLFGSKKNFESIAKNLSLTGHQVITVDARNHGESPHSPEMNYHAMSEDLELLLKDLNLKSAIFLGHSMGGKTAMTLALTKPHLVDMLIVEDISPTVSRSTQVTAFPQYIDAMNRVTFDPEITNLTEARKAANKQLMATFPDKVLRDFILTNVDQRSGKFTWRINLDAIRSNLNDVIEFPRFNGSYHGKAVFIGGRNSPQISQSDYPEIHRLFPRAVVRHVDGAGHWVHSEKPHNFIDIVKQFLVDYERNKSNLEVDLSQ